jgi:hypothetical protein
MARNEIDYLIASKNESKINIEATEVTTRRLPDNQVPPSKQISR